MVQHNTDRHETGFTVSIDHISTTTGISAADRCATARACVDHMSQPEDFRRLGHMFRLLARPHGVLQCNGHTEATVDLCRLAGVEECGLCCEIIRDDGTMMRGPELSAFAEQYGLTYITIRDIQEWRKAHEELVEQVTKANMPTKYGNSTIYGFINRLTQEHHVALVKGDIADGHDVLVRVHSECLTGDTFGSLRCDCGQQLAAALQQIEREYYIGAQILRELGVRSMRLLTNNPDEIYQLEEFGMEIVERVPIVMDATPYDSGYLHTKRAYGTYIVNHQ